MFILDIILKVLATLLPWIFSGQETTKVTTQPGLEGMDRASLSGTKDLNPRDLPALAMVFGTILLGLGGCAFGGAQVVHHYKLVEPGGVVEAVDGKVKVRSPGTDDVGEISAAGHVLMPKSVYRELRQEWLKAHPETADTRP